LVAWLVFVSAKAAQALPGFGWTRQPDLAFWTGRLILRLSPVSVGGAGERDEAMKLTYYGHACCAVETGGKHLLFDPFIRPNPLAAKIDVTRIRADFIFVSHGHSDHLSDAVEISRRTGATIVAIYEIAEWLSKQGAPHVHGMNLGGAWPFDFGRVKLVAAVHSSTLPDGSPGGSAGGFVVESSEGNFYYAGDTALTYDMKLIGESTPLRCAIFNIGGNFTMGVEDAIKAADFVNCRKIVGVHFNTFPPIVLNEAQAIRLFRDAGKELILLEIGQTAEV
jgi:L-ascorbate metabolism protein UlaG (beta-lactamase superfamily)